MVSMDAQSEDYLAYLLRLWRVRDVDESQWRASLEDAETGERRGFANIERLCEFLQQQCVDANDKPSTTGI